MIIESFFVCLYFSIFGFASLFSVFPRYGIYGSKCSVNTLEKKGCPEQIAEYQVRLELCGGGGGEQEEKR